MRLEITLLRVNGFQLNWSDSFRLFVNLNMFRRRIPNTMYLTTIRRYCCEHINFTDIFCNIMYVTLADKKLVPVWLKLAHGGIRQNRVSLGDVHVVYLYLL